ncbi:hypothetical protein Taro_050058 [Colocasia esculenta]|uniref:Uncharacterized protein n=1 Tax=Colocasia esculenta TaxID=4460 RepID=A0A843XCV6_COLES|nr:hypothetical protein [Colocasia esculenta]
MAADYWLATITLDVDPSWRPHPWTPACGWRPDPWTSIGFTWSAQQPRDSSPLAPFSRPCNACSRSQRAYGPPRHPIGPERPAEEYGALLLWSAEGGEVEVPPSPATRGHCTDVITATPWAQSTQSTGGSTWSTGDPFIANESSAASRFASERSGDGAETNRLRRVAARLSICHRKFWQPFGVTMRLPSSLTRSHSFIEP